MTDPKTDPQTDDESTPDDVEEPREDEEQDDLSPEEFASRSHKHSPRAMDLLK